MVVPARLVPDSTQKHPSMEVYEREHVGGAFDNRTRGPERPLLGDARLGDARRQQLLVDRAGRIESEEA
jgi:hypothetical protein